MISHLDFMENNNMRITERGRYILTEESRIRSGISVATCPAGMVFDVVQLDLMGFKFYSPQMDDWQHYYFPAKRMFSEGDRIAEMHKGHLTESKGIVIRVGDGFIDYLPDGCPIDPDAGRQIYDSDAVLLPNPEGSLGGTETKSQDQKPSSAAQVYPVVGQSICPVCNKPIEENNMSSTGYIDYHKDCNLV